MSATTESCDSSASHALAACLCVLRPGLLLPRMPVIALGRPTCRPAGYQCAPDAACHCTPPPTPLSHLPLPAAGKSSLLRVLAGVDTNFEGRLVLAPGIKIGYLEQEPELKDGDTVASNIQPAVAAVRDMVAQYEAVSVAMGEPGADLEALTTKMDSLQAALDAINGWEIERTVAQAMDALRCPPPEEKVANLSGGGEQQQRRGARLRR